MAALCGVILAAPFFFGKQMALTQIIDTWHNADGSLFNGTLRITALPTATGAIVYADTQSISQQTITVQIQNGLVNFSLQANDIAQPFGTTYSVYVFAGRGLSWTEVWTVPSSSVPLALAAVRGLAVGLRRAIVFPLSSTWTLPASKFGISSAIPIILTYDTSGNQILGTTIRNMSTGDIVISWVVPQAGVVEILLTGAQYTASFTNQSTVSIDATTAGLSNVAAVAVLDTTGLYIVEGVSILFAVIAASPSSLQSAALAAVAGGNIPFATNFAGTFLNVTFEFSIPQSGTVVLLGS